MRLVFVDETSDKERRDYFGLCIATMNAKSYSLLKKRCRKILTAIEWDPAVEFKGSFLFSSSKGCPGVPVDKRIEAASALLNLNVASSNSRMVFHYIHGEAKNTTEAYFAQLPVLLRQALPRAPGGAGKNLLMLVADERPDVTLAEVETLVGPVVEDRGWTLLERVSQVGSTFDTVGVMFADIVGYLQARIDTIETDDQLFDLDSEAMERSSRIRKLRSSQELISCIKQLNVHVPKNKPRATPVSP